MGTGPGCPPRRGLRDSTCVCAALVAPVPTGSPGLSRADWQGRPRAPRPAANRRQGCAPPPGLAVLPPGADTRPQHLSQSLGRAGGRACIRRRASQCFLNE